MKNKLWDLQANIEIYYSLQHFNCLILSGQGRGQISIIAFFFNW